MNYSCGIYRIDCAANQQIYVGSSLKIQFRWRQHQRLLSANKHTCTYLQHSWNKYGASSFSFSIIEECVADKLLEREQVYIDLLHPLLNVMQQVDRWTPTKEMRAKLNALRKEKAAARIHRTHCKRGHELTVSNIRISRKGVRICRACVNFESNAANMPPQARARRLAQKKAYYLSNRSVLIEKMKSRYLASRELRL